MNLELNGHRITLGPKALAFIETNMRGMGEVYCRDQLELWLAGGKVGPDVTITGPERFVPKGNEIGIPMKAGVAPASVAESKTGSKEPLPVASAAPADLYEPVGTMPQRGDRVVCLINPKYSYPWVNRLHEEGARFASEYGTFEVRDGEFNRYDDRGWRILKRQAPPARKEAK